jgi:hypothetical protein
MLECFLKMAFLAQLHAITLTMSYQLPPDVCFGYGLVRIGDDVSQSTTAADTCSVAVTAEVA